MFFDILQYECDLAGISISLLLDNVGLSRGNINRWKKGLNPKPSTRNLLADELGIPRERLRNEESPTAEAGGIDDKLLRMIEEAKSGHTAIILGFDGGKAEVREISKEQYEATKILLGDINKEK